MADLFEETPAESTETNVESDPIVVIKQKFSKDGKVDEDALAKAKAESDAFIERLKQEAAGLREELTKRTSFDELLSRLEQKTSSEDTSVNHTPQTKTNDDIPNKAMSNEAIEEIVTKTLSKETQKASQVKNVNEVRSELKKAWGNDFANKLKQITEDLEISQEDAGLMAAQKPKAFLRLVLGSTPTQQAPSTAPPSSSFRQTTTVTTGKNYSYFKKMMDDPNPRVRNEYWSPRIQNEMHRLAQQLGDSFYSN